MSSLSFLSREGTTVNVVIKLLSREETTVNVVIKLLSREQTTVNVVIKLSSREGTTVNVVIKLLSRDQPHKDTETTARTESNLPNIFDEVKPRLCGLEQQPYSSL
jgi:hypothetical protein